MIYCHPCAEKMRDEHGPAAMEGGCAVCKKKCCCGDRSRTCKRKYHCIKRCPSMFVDPDRVGTEDLVSDQDKGKPKCRISGGKALGQRRVTCHRCGVRPPCGVC